MELKDVKTMHTKQLINELQGVRAEICNAVEYGVGAEPAWIERKELLKAELATREHVPNKQEAKAIRQEKARRK